jgi:hypothetical protein
MKDLNREKESRVVQAVGVVAGKSPRKLRVRGARIQKQFKIYS